jgi:phosphoribosylanthranilate isomerase
VASRADVAGARGFAGVADLVLFDARAPVDSSRPGGNGEPFDWQALAGVAPAPFVLSGGLTPDNVAAAIRITGATMVDVSSGVERRPGEKDCALIGQFIRAAKGV